MPKPQDTAEFRVIIVGGGIAGLALANSLQHANIDYVVLEKGKRLDPQVGAGIGVLPNAARILDQLDCFDDLGEMTAGMHTSASRRQDGSIIGRTTDTLQLMKIRTGYPVYFIDRQQLLRVLSLHLKDRDRIRLGVAVRNIEIGSSAVSVHCDDGSTESGDIVVGADGVHSTIRREMWRHADNAGLRSMFTQDDQAMSAEYKCLFGISLSIQGMDEGQTDRTYAKNMSTLSYVGKGGRVFWFLFVKMDKVYYPPSIPKFTKEDAQQLVKQHGSLAIRENGSVTISDLYDKRLTCSLVPIEEAEYKCWSYDRIVCLGDSIHKGTPNLGAGASSAIESAATLSNNIVRLASKQHKTSDRPPTTSDVANTFQEYQRARTLRVKTAMKFTNALTRVQALKGTKEYIYTHYLAPLLDDFAAESFSDFTIGATKIDHLPIPARSLQGTMPFNPKQGWGYKESKRQRVIRALPLIVVALVSLIISSLPSFKAEAGDGNSLRPHSTLSEVLYAIWLLEASRLNNKGTLAQCPVLFGLATQYLGTGMVGPLYFFFLYTHSPMESFRASDNRLTDASYVVTITPLLVLLGFFARWFSIYPFRLDTGFVINGDLVIKLRPYVLSVLQFLLTNTLLHSTIRHDRLWAVRNDVRWVRGTIASMMFTFICLQISWASFETLSLEPGAVLLHHARSMLVLCQENLCWTAGAIIWLGLVLHDFRQAGVSSTTGINALGLGVLVLACLGPSCALLAGWLWREEILIHKREKHAVVVRNCGGYD